MTGCPHGMPAPASCVECMYEGPVGEPSRPPRPYVEHRYPAAQFDGHCGGCNLPIRVGEPIARLSTFAYVHQGACEP